MHLRIFKPGSESPFAPLLTNSHDSAVPLSSLRLLQHQRLLPSVLNDIKRSFDKSCHLLYLFRLLEFIFHFLFFSLFSPLPISHTTRIFLSRIKQWFLKALFCSLLKRQVGEAFPERKLRSSTAFLSRELNFSAHNTKAQTTRTTELFLHPIRTGTLPIFCHNARS